VLQSVTVLFVYDQRFSMRILLPSPQADTAAKLLRLMSTREVQENYKEY